MVATSTEIFKNELSFKYYVTLKTERFAYVIIIKEEEEKEEETGNRRYSRNHRPSGYVVPACLISVASFFSYRCLSYLFSLTLRKHCCPNYDSAKCSCDKERGCFSQPTNPKVSIYNMVGSGRETLSNCENPELFQTGSHTLVQLAVSMY